MSLYHEAVEFLIAPPSAGGSLKARVFKQKNLKSPPNQLYALVLETSKWSPVLKEVIDRAEVLKHERKVSASRYTALHCTERHVMGAALFCLLEALSRSALACVYMSIHEQPYSTPQYTIFIIQKAKSKKPYVCY
jgi:hypothetical protein